MNLIFKKHISKLQISRHLSPQPSGKQKTSFAAAAGAPAQHCTAMTNWPNTIQCLGSDDIMSLGIKSSAFLRVLVLKTVQELGPSFLDMSWTRRYGFLFSWALHRICAMLLTKIVHFLNHSFFKNWIPFQVNFVVACRQSERRSQQRRENLLLPRRNTLPE